MLALTYAVIILMCNTFLYYGISEFLVLYTADLNRNYSLLENMIESNCYKGRNPSINANKDLKEKLRDSIQFHSDSKQLSQTIFLTHLKE